jgi:hypothetical protein
MLFQMPLQRAPWLRVLIGSLPIWLWPTVVGTALRLYRIDEQVLVEDELHGVRVALGSTVGRILTNYETGADPCAPLAALVRLVYLATGDVSVLAMRLPSVIAGILLIVVLPSWLASRKDGDFTPGALKVVAWLLALSPSLVLYSRIGRPYALVVLFGVLAAIACDRLWRERGIRPALLYAIAGALTIWFFVGATPFVAALLLSTALTKLSNGRDAPSWASIAGAGAGLAAAISLFLLPSFASLVELVEAKVSLNRLAWPEIFPVFELQAGVGNGWVAATVCLLALAGLFRLARRDRRLALFTALPVGVQAFGLWLLSPQGLGNPVVFNRYLLIALPFLLLWFAESLTAIGVWVANRGVVAVRGMIPAAFFLLFAAGPLADSAMTWSSFLHSHELLSYYTPRSTLPAAAMPDFYLSESAQQGGGILEYNGLPSWAHIDTLVVFQEAHRQPVWMAPHERGLFPSGSPGFGRLVRPEPGAFLASPARWLVVHLDAETEQASLMRPGALGLQGFDPVLGERGRRFAAVIAEELSRIWGRPHFTGDGWRVWDLDDVRASREKGGPAGDQSPSTPAVEGGPPASARSRSRRARASGSPGASSTARRSAAIASSRRPSFASVVPSSIVAIADDGWTATARSNQGSASDERPSSSSDAPRL